MSTVELLGHTLVNPLIASSGTFGYGADQKGVDLEKIGAVIIKSLTVEKRAGNPPPRIAEVRKDDILACFYDPGELENSLGFVNSIGLQNVGIEEFLVRYAPLCLESRSRFIGSIAGESIKDYSLLTKKLEENCLDFLLAIEVNISCPNIDRGLVFGTDPTLTYELVSALKEATKIPLLVKLTPNTDDICTVAEAAVSAGADGLSLINTIKVTVRTRDGQQLTGGLSGPMIRPVARRLVRKVCDRFADKVPVIAGGGVWSKEDVEILLSYGATAVSVGTLNFTRPDAILKLISEFES